MNEKLLHFIWKFRLFDTRDLKTTEGEKIELIQQGVHNTNSGADFQNAKIRIGKTLWAGNVEIHINAGDWLTHRHEKDAAYNNVILHVVYEKNGKAITGINNARIPTLELKDRVNPSTISRYEELSKRKAWIPCEKFFPEASKFTLTTFLERLSVERLEGKVEQINLLLAESENDWENVMFQLVAKYLGASINKEPFLQLAQSLPVKIWAKHQNDPLQIEALVFGQAGMLDESFDDEYPNRLRKEYNYLKRLHRLEPLPKHLWKFLRLRPANFPTIRLAQLAALMNKEIKIFSAILEAKNAKAILKFFDVEVADYWQTHYLFDKPTKSAKAHTGIGVKNILLINAVAPVLFAYGKYKDKEEHCDRAIELLENCKPESNAIIKKWETLGIKAENAFETQALLQLKNEYCQKFRCLECAVGHNILK